MINSSGIVESPNGSSAEDMNQEWPLPLIYMPSSVPLHTQHVLSIRDYMHSQRHVCHEQSNEVVRRCDNVMVDLGYEHLLQPLPLDDVPSSTTQTDVSDMSTDHQSPYTLSVHPTTPGPSQGECSYVSPVHPTNLRLHQQSDSEGTPSSISYSKHYLKGRYTHC